MNDFGQHYLNLKQFLTVFKLYVASEKLHMLMIRIRSII